jgi:MarR family transcriptional regulator, lower aerobic nicotinate degradation pathway regulator
LNIAAAMPSATESPKPRTRKPQRPYVLDDQVGFILRQASQRHAVIFAERMIEELTPTQFTALVKLHSEGAVSQNRLGRLAAMDAATIKGVIDRLSARGYVEGRADPGDARRRVLSLTPKGRELIENALPIAAAITEETLAPLGKEERVQFLALLRRLC